MAYLAQKGIINRVKEKWEQIADLLGQTADVASIRRKHVMDDYSCCSTVFQAWINNAGCDAYPVTWKGLRDILCHENVRHRRIARDLGIDI
jgi:hypothetical protein